MRIFVCSPLRGVDVEANLSFARRACRHVIDLGHAPFAPHLIYPQFLDDHQPVERHKGLMAGFDFLSTCNEVWVFGHRVSPGMEAEIALALSLGKTINYIKDIP